MPIVHVFGDSHTRAFSKIPNVHLHQTNGMSLREVGELGMRYDLSPWGRKDRNDAVFVYGAVDARVHIGRLAIDSQIDEAEVISPIAEKFVHQLVLFCDEWNLRGFVSSVIPAVDLKKANPEAVIPTLGTLEERIKRTQLLDSNVQALCWRQHPKIRWFDPHKPFRTPEGGLNMDHSDSIVHLNDNCQEEVARIFMTIQSEVSGSSPTEPT